LVETKKESKKSPEKEGNDSKEKIKGKKEQKRKVTTKDLPIYDGVTIVAGLKYEKYFNNDTTEMIAVVLQALDSVLIEVVDGGRLDVGYEFGKLITLFIEKRMEELNEIEEKDYIQ